MAEPITHIYLGAASLLTALGDTDATLRAMRGYQSGLRKSPKLGMIAGLIDPAEPMAQSIADFTRFEALVIRQVESVCARSGITLADPSVRMILSTTKGNVDSLEQMDGAIPPEAYLGESAERIASHFAAAHRPIVISNACISGVTAFVVGRHLLLGSDCRHVVVVGCDLLSTFITAGFASFKSISDAPCRPYDASRNGLSLGEACGAVVLTTDRKRAIDPIILLEGAAVSNDANHISGPSRTGDGLYYAIERALTQAGITAEQVGMVNTHGTATRYNDEMESKAVAWAHLSATPLNSVKGYLGHTLGASGVIETLLCAEELRSGDLFATLGYNQTDVPCLVNISTLHRKIEIRRCVKSASGFGGCNAALVLAAESCNDHPLPYTKQGEATQVATYTLPHSDLPFADFIRQEFRALEQPNMKFYKMSDLCKAAYVAAERLLANYPAWVEISPTRRAIVLSNRSSSLEADLAHQEVLNTHAPEGASPALFVYTLPNVAAGEICIRHKIQGDNTFFIESSKSNWVESYAQRLIASGEADAVICGQCEKAGEDWQVALKLFVTKNR